MSVNKFRRISDGTGTHPREQKVAAGFSHEFFDPDVSTEILARFDCLGGNRGRRVIDQQNV